LSRNLILAALALLAQGCQQPEQGLGNIPQATATESQDSMPEADSPTTGTRLSFWGVGLSQDGPVGGAAARLEGVLSRLDGCLVVTASNGRRVQPVFPAGKARWDEAAGTLSFAGRLYRTGDRIALGGGGVSSPSAYAREAGVRLADCPVAELFAVVG
jgi:hypothetical protein